MLFLASFLLTLQIEHNHGLNAYKSLEPINATNPFAGLRLLKETIKNDTNFTQGITICSRFNYKQLNTWIFTVHRPGGPFSFAAMAFYEESFLFFGGMNWIVKDTGN